MFLYNLNPQEKEYFLSLVYQIAKVDGNYDNEEINIIEKYKFEFGLKEIREDKSISELVDYFSSKELSVRKTVLFEVYYLIISDDVLDKNEVSSLSLLETRLGISPNLVNEIETTVEELNDIYCKIDDMLS